MDRRRHARVHIIALGSARRRLVQSFSQHYTTFATGRSRSSTAVNDGITTGLYENGVWWTSRPGHLKKATHIIISTSADDGTDQMEKLMWVLDRYQMAFFNLADSKSSRPTRCTIILAGPMPDVGTTRKLLGKYRRLGHRVGIAPQVSAYHGLNCKAFASLIQHF